MRVCARVFVLSMCVWIRVRAPICVYCRSVRMAGHVRNLGRNNEEREEVFDYFHTCVDSAVGLDKLLHLLPLRNCVSK